MGQSTRYPVRLASLDRLRVRIHFASENYNVTTNESTVPIALPPSELLEINGPDAVAFAHAQFSSDVRALTNGHWQWSAWLSAQGRVRSLFRVLRRSDERLILFLSGGSAVAMQKALAPFVMRAKVHLGIHEHSIVLGYRVPADGARDLGALPVGDAIVDLPLLEGFAIAVSERRWCLVAGKAPDGEFDSSDDGISRWRSDDIADGIPCISGSQADRYLPQWIGLSRLGAINTGKGCYPGQEIVARLHFKGGNRRWLHRLEFSSPDQFAPSLPLCTDGGAQIGELLNAAWTSAAHGTALAVLQETPIGSLLRACEDRVGTFRVISVFDRASG